MMMTCPNMSNTGDNHPQAAFDAVERSMVENVCRPLLRNETFVGWRGRVFGTTMAERRAVGRDVVRGKMPPRC